VIILTAKGFAGSNILKNTTNTLRISNFRNPQYDYYYPTGNNNSPRTWKDDGSGECTDAECTVLKSHIITRIYSSDQKSAYKIYEGKHLNVFEKVLESGNCVTNRDGTTTLPDGPTTTFTEISTGNGLEFTFKGLATDIKPETGAVILIRLHSSWSFLNTGETAISCSTDVSN
jgi:hypothetical protein